MKKLLKQNLYSNPAKILMFLVAPYRWMGAFKMSGMGATSPFVRTASTLDSIVNKPSHESVCKWHSISYDRAIPITIILSAFRQNGLGPDIRMHQIRILLPVPFVEAAVTDMVRFQLCTKLTCSSHLAFTGLCQLSPNKNFLFFLSCSATRPGSCPAWRFSWALMLRISVSLSLWKQFWVERCAPQDVSFGKLALPGYVVIIR